MKPFFHFLADEKGIGHEAVLKSFQRQPGCFLLSLAVWPTRLRQLDAHNGDGIRRLAEQDVVDLCAFLQTTKPPRLRHAEGGKRVIDTSVVEAGKRVFEAECASCHSNGQRGRHTVLSDDLIHPVSAIGTNACRALTTNWATGHIWAAFSSDQYKARPTGGPGF
jgi:Cytochrome c